MRSILFIGVFTLLIACKNSGEAGTVSFSGTWVSPCATSGAGPLTNRLTVTADRIHVEKFVYTDANCRSGRELRSQYDLTYTLTVGTAESATGGAATMDTMKWVNSNPENGMNVITVFLILEYSRNDIRLKLIDGSYLSGGVVVPFTKSTIDSSEETRFSRIF